MRYDLKSVLLAIAIYTPIIMLAISASIVWGEIIDDDPFRIPRGLFLFLCCFAIFMTALMTLLHNIRKSEGTTPTFAAHIYYQRAEIATSLASLAAVATVFLLSS